MQVTPETPRHTLSSAATVANTPHAYLAISTGDLSRSHWKGGMTQEESLEMSLYHSVFITTTMTSLCEEGYVLALLSHPSVAVPQPGTRRLRAPGRGGSRSCLGRARGSDRLGAAAVRLQRYTDSTAVCVVCAHIEGHRRVFASIAQQ